MTKLFSKWSGLALALASTGATARDLPNYEVLQDAPPSLRSTPSRSASAQRRKTPEARVAHRDAQHNLPTFVWATPNTSTALSSRTNLARMTPEQALHEQLGEYLSLYGHESLTEAGASITSVSRDTRGVSVVTIAQQQDGVEVFRQGLKVLLNANNEVVAISGNLTPHASTRTSAARASSLRYQLTAAEAISLAYRDLTGASLDGSLLTRMTVRAQDNNPYTHYQLAPYARPLEEGLRIPARARRVFYPLPTGLVPAYYLELNTGPAESTDSDYYAYVVSAADGRLLMRNNLMAHADFSYRVWAETTPPYIPLDGPAGGSVTPHPTGTPWTIDTPPFVAPSLVTLRNAPFSKNDPWLPDGATQTQGNNVDAYADLKSPDGFGTGDIRATVTAPGVFDRSIDFSLQPYANQEQIQAAITQLFYMNNWLHDWFYDVGFDEAAGNAQQDNFGRGGLAGDVLLAEAQDYSGRNNANMWTPADGESPVMQMYLFNGSEQYLEVLTPESLAGLYSAGYADFGPPGYDLSREVVLAASGDTTPPKTDACAALTNAAEVAGKIALFDRSSDCSVNQQMLNVQTAGAVGAIIVNATEQLFRYNITDPAITIPSMNVTLSMGKKFKGAIPGLTTRLYRNYRLDLDGTIDNGIVAHEWGHYISNRLIWNAAGLTNNQGRSMGEGWADVTALLMMTRAEDIHVPSNANWNGAYAAAEYATRAPGMSEDSTFFGIRRVTYSADMAKNALTFRHITDGEPLPTSAPITPFFNNAEYHNSGEIWATMLWDCYVALLRAYPFEEAQHRMKQYLVNGYKLTPARPTFLEARDAIIAAASAGDKEDGHRFWKAFARRGAGGGAVAPDRSSTTHAGVVESYDLIALDSLSLEAVSKTCDRDGILDNGETGLLRIKLRNVGPDQTEHTQLIVTANSPNVTLGNDGQVQVPLLQEAEETEITLPVSLQGAAKYQPVGFTVVTHQDGQTHPDNVKGSLRVLVNYDEQPASSATEIAESGFGPWTVENDGNLADMDWSVITHPTPSNHVFFGENTDAPNDMRLITPPLSVSATEPLVLEFKQAWDFEWYPAGVIDDEAIYFDGAVIELSEDEGQTWKDVGESLYNGTLFHADDNLNPLDGRKAFVGRSTGFPALISSTLDLGTAYAGKTVRLRFRVGSDLNTGANGWLLDDLKFNGITHTPFTTIQEEEGVCVKPPPPVITAGEDVSVEERTSLTLHGSATDEDDSPLTYAWTQESGPPVTLTGADTLTPSFATPEVTAHTELVFTLSVSNGSHTVTDTVTVTVTNVNRAPTAHAGEAISVEAGVQTQLDGSLSSDPDGDALTYTWTQVEGTPPVTLTGANTATPSFSTSAVRAQTTLRFSLVVKDGSLSSEPAFVSVTITPKTGNEPPRCGCSTGAEAPLGLLGLGLLALARRRRSN